MKSIKSYMMILLAGAFALAACSPEDYDGVNPSQIPNASDYAAQVVVDQENNTATFTLVTKDGQEAQGVYPIWNISAGRTYKNTVNGFTTSKIVVAGDYSYTVQVANRNGVSDGTLEGTFNIQTTRYDFTKFVQLLTGNSSKEWRIYANKMGHMDMYNPSFTEHWWQAGPQEKASEGMYDDIMTFTASDQLSTGNYKYNAGPDGNTFLLSTCTNIGVQGGVGSDYSYPLVDDPAAQTDVEYALGYDAELDAVTITLPAGTLIPCMTHDVVVSQATTYTVETIDDKVMIWRIGVPSAGWKFTFISGDDLAEEEGVGPDDVNWTTASNDLNLAKIFNEQECSNYDPYWADNNWGVISAPSYSYADGIHTFAVSQANGWSQWQGQIRLPDWNISLSDTENYDISVKVKSTDEVENVTFKICQTDDDNKALLQESVSFKAGDNLIRFAKKNPGGSFDVAKVIFDCPGTPAGAEFQVSELIIQKHNPK